MWPYSVHDNANFEKIQREVRRFGIGAGGRRGGAIYSVSMRRIFLYLYMMAATAAGQAQTVVPKVYYRTFAHTNPVFERIRPGQVVATQTLDSSGRDLRGEVRHPESGNPLTGPFYVEGAAAGDAILVHLRKVRLNRNWGYSGFRLGLYALEPEAVEGIYPDKTRPDAVIRGRSNMVKWDLDLERGQVALHDPKSARVKMEFPAIPMLGCIGVAAPGDFAPTSGPAGSYGGNMDYNQVREGATVILPVYHPGALLYVGDGHALMADGEPTGNGIETSMDVEFSVDVRKGMNLSGPRLENAEYVISVGAQPEFVSSLDRGLQMATTDMVAWLTKEYRLEPWAAHVLIAMQGKYEVVTVAGTMALKVPRKYLPEVGNGHR
jgi:amidase